MHLIGFIIRIYQMHGPLNVKFALSFTFLARLGHKFGKGDVYKNFNILNDFSSSVKIIKSTAVL